MAAVIFLGGSALFDIRNRKIPNGWLIFWVLLWAVLLLPLSGQPPRAILRFLGRTAGTLLLLFPLFRFRLAGAGDLKTAALLAGMIGPLRAGRAFLFGLVPAALMAAVLLLKPGLAAERFRYFAGYLRELKEYADARKLGEETSKRRPPAYRSSSGRDAEFCLVPFFFLGLLAQERQLFWELPALFEKLL
ncbi:MAG: prepilin peptidase [Clostridium sp.]|nr:prepilin peptidase [Clostridium sp.]